MIEHELTLEQHGAQHMPDAAKAILQPLQQIFAGLPAGFSGVRLAGDAALAQMLQRGSIIDAIAVNLLGQQAQPVRAIAFDKSPGANWSLGWHQDRTICVRHRIETAGFGPWTVKQGLHHVAPPMAVTNSMMTLRVHLDDTPTDNAPLLIALGSHQIGRIAEADIAAVVARSGPYECTAAAGDIWVYRTPIIHASKRSTAQSRRRVLHIDYAAEQLPNGLEWLGI
jgi:ectoine hydroxylase-related dioxygenase (phytanoyl-CoA dioxygenase family)